MANTRRIGGWAAALGLAGVLASGQALAEAPAKAPAVESPAARHFLWKATKGKRTAWLLGSVHLADKSFYPLAPAIERAFAGTRALAVEVNLRAADLPALQAKMLEGARYPAGDGLSKHVSPEMYVKVRERLAAFGLELRALEPFRPWFVALTVASLAVRKAGLDPELGIDVHFLDQANARGDVRILELEGFDQQIGLFRGFSEADQVRFLDYSLLEAQQLVTELEKLLTAWKRGDAKGLEALLLAAENESPEVKPIMEVLFTRRNREMAKKVEAMAQAADTFVVVGAGHLVGPTGLVELLRARGYAVEQY